MTSHEPTFTAMMTPMETDPLVDEALLGLEERLGQNGVNLDPFAPPASVDEVETAFSTFPHFRLTPSVLSFYRWHNGFSDLFPVVGGHLRYTSVAGAVDEIKSWPARLESLFDYWVFDDEDPTASTNAMPLWPLFQGEFSPMVVVLPGCSDEGAVYKVSWGKTVGLKGEPRLDSLLDLVTLWNDSIDAERFVFRRFGDRAFCDATEEWFAEAERRRRQSENRQLWLA